MENRKCVQCGMDFVLTDGEIEFYRKKGLTLPKRCPECREKNKKEKNAPKVIKRSAPAKSGKIPAWAIVAALAVIFAFALVIIIPRFSNVGTIEITSDATTQSQNVIPDPGEESSHTVNSTPSYYGKDDSGDENFTISGGYSGGEESPVYNGGSSNSGSSSYSGSSGNYSQSSSDAMAPPAQSSSNSKTYSGYTFRSSSLLASHFTKHGREVGASSETEYVNMANNVINSADQHKKEKEDDDIVYFKSSTGEFVVLSDDGYIRTYYIADQAYYDRQ